MGDSKSLKQPAALSTRSGLSQIVQADSHTMKQSCTPHDSCELMCHDTLMREGLHALSSFLKPWDV
jgi:hypothetical protein